MPSLVASNVDLDAAHTDDLKDTALETTDKLPAQEKQDVVEEIGKSLTAEQRMQLAEKLAGQMWPRGDWAKAAIYLAGFFVAGAVLILAGLIAWQAQGDENSIASDLIVAASSLVSLLIGGLVGAYVQR